MRRSILLLTFCLGVALPAWSLQAAEPEVAIKIPDATIRLTARQRDKIVKAYEKEFQATPGVDKVQAEFDEAEFWFNAYLDERAERREVPELFNKAYPVLERIAGRGYVTLANSNARTEAIRLLVRTFKEGLGIYKVDNLRAQFYEKLLEESNAKTIELAKIADASKPKYPVEGNRYRVNRTVEGTPYVIIYDANANESNCYGVGIANADGVVTQVVIPTNNTSRLWVGPYAQSKRYRSLAARGGGIYYKDPVRGQTWERYLPKEPAAYTKAPERIDFSLRRVNLPFTPETIVFEDEKEPAFAAGTRIGSEWKLIPIDFPGGQPVTFTLYDLFRYDWE